MKTAQVVQLDLVREAAIINDLHATYSTASRTTLDAARKIGEHLLGVKASVGHGKFKAWIEANCTFSYSQATRYLQVVKNVSETFLPGDTIAKVAARGSVKRKPKAQQTQQVTGPKTWIQAIVAHFGGFPAGYAPSSIDRHGTPQRLAMTAECGFDLPCESDKFPAVIAAMQRLLDREMPVPAAARVNLEVAEQPEKAQAKIDRLVAEKVNIEVALLRGRFEAEVEAKVEERIGKREDKLLKREELVEQRAKRLDAWMTEEEFKVVLGCLHPDSVPPAERKARAFTIFNQLKVHLSRDAGVLRDHGWSKQ